MNIRHQKQKLLITEFVEIPAWAHDEWQIEYDPELFQDNEAIVNRLRGTAGLIIRNQTKVTHSLLASSDALRAIGRLGVGLDNIDLPAARNKNVKVVYSPNANTNAVAEYCLGQIISCARKFRYADSSTRAGAWNRIACMGRELAELTVGLVGYGRIAAKLSELLQPMGCTQLIASRHLQGGDTNKTVVSLPELFANADVISIHLQGGATTKHFIDAALLNQMKEQVIFINTARGDVLLENDLLEAIRQRPDASFVLDVRETEPPATDLFANFPNIVASPHIAAFSHRAQKLVTDTVFNDVRKILNGEEPSWPA